MNRKIFGLGKDAGKVKVSLLLLTLAGLTGFVALTALAKPHPHKHAPSATMDPDEMADMVGQREEWFRRGRKSPDKKPAAAHRNQALEQAKRLPIGPVFLSKSGFSAMKPLSGAPPAGPACDWTEIGPSPNTGSSWANVSGRITSLGLDLTHDGTGNTVYLGAAYGGLWFSTNGLSATPTFSFIGDPSHTLAVGSFGVDTSHGSIASNYLYIGTGEPENGADSYYGLGILQSQSNGTPGSWTLVNSATAPAAIGGYAVTMLGLSFSKIIVDSQRPQTVLAGGSLQSCCDPGLSPSNPGPYPGIYVTENYGTSWNWLLPNAILNQGFTTSCTDLAYDTSTNTYYAVFAANPNVTSVAGIYQCSATSDPANVANWTPLPVPAGQAGSPFWNGSSFGGGAIFYNLGPPAYTNFNRISLSARNGILYVLVSDTNGLPSAPSGQDTGLYQFQKSSSTWSAINVPAGIFGGNNQGWYDIYVSAPSGSSALYLGGFDTWSASSVNGTSTSWANVTTGHAHPDQHAIAFASPSNFYIGNDGGLWSDQSGTWTNANNNIGTIQFMSVSPDLFNLGTYFGGSQDNGTEKTTGVGLTWNEIWAGDGGFTDTGSISGEYYTENYFVSLQKSTNGGGSWSQIASEPTFNESADFYVPYKVIPGSSPTSLVYGACSVWRWNGSSWSQISSPLIPNSGVPPNPQSTFIQALDVSASNSNYIYASTLDERSYPFPATLFGTSNANNAAPSWVNITGTLWSGGSLTVRPINAIAVDPITPTTVYVGLQGFANATGKGHVLVNTNPFGGGGWTDITGNLPDAPVNSILIDPLFHNDLYVATDVGVYYTQSVNGASTSWTKLGTALPDTTIFQLKMSTGCNRQIVAATHGRGAWTICPIDAACVSTPTPTSTSTNTYTNTSTRTNTSTYTPTYTYTNTSTPTYTFTSTYTNTNTPINTITPTWSSTPGCCVAQMIYGTGVAGPGLGQFHSPIGEVQVGNTLYVADASNSRIDIMNQTSGAPLGYVSNPSGFAFNVPRRIAADGEATPHLFMVDNAAARVFIIDTSTNSVVNSFTDATMQDPEGICVNSAGTTVVVSENAGPGGNGRIRVFTTLTNPATGFYSVFTPLNVPAGLHPIGMAMDAFGNVFTTLTKAGTNQIGKYNYWPALTYNTTAVILLNNPPGLLNNPNDIALDNTGKMYIIDAGGDYEVYDSVGHFLKSCNSASGLGLNVPQGINLNAAGNVYVGDTANNRVVMFYPCTPTPTATPTPGCCVVLRTYGDGTSGSSPWQLNIPMGVIQVGANLYIVEPNNSRINIMNQATGISVGFVSNPSGFPFITPRRIVADGEATPHLFMVDSSTARVYIIDTTNNSVVNSFTGPSMNDPEGVCVNSDGTTVVVSENAGHQIRVFAASTNNLNIATYSPIQTLTPPGGGIVFAPLGMRMNAAGDVFVANPGGPSTSNAILKYKYSYLTTPPAYSTAPPVVWQNATHLNGPMDIALDSFGNMYVVNGNGNNYEVYDPSGNFTGITCGGLSGPNGISLDPSGNLYIGDSSNYRVALFAQCTPVPPSQCCQLAGSPWVSPGPISGAQWGMAIDPVRNWFCTVNTGSPNGALNVYQTYDGQAVETISSSLLAAAWVVAAGPSPLMYVGCRDGSICSVNLLTKAVNQVTAHAGAARGIFVDPSGTIYETADNNGGDIIYIVTSGGTVSNIVPGNIGTSGIPLSYSMGIVKIGSGPGTLYVADQVNHRVVSIGLSSYNTASGLSGVVFSGGVNGPNNPTQMALLGDSQSGNFYVGSEDGGYWYYKNLNPGWSTALPKSCTGGVFNSFGNVFGTAVDPFGDIFIMNQNGAIDKVAPCTSGSGQPSSAAPFTGSSLGEGATATPTPTPKPNATTFTPTPTETPSPTPNLASRFGNGAFAMAVPNVSKDGGPIRFLVDLDKPMNVEVSLFNISGEKIFDEVLGGNPGINTINWGLNNQAGGQVASGLYLYRIEATDGTTVISKTGKVAVLH